MQRFLYLLIALSAGYRESATASESNPLETSTLTQAVTTWSHDKTSDNAEKPVPNDLIRNSSMYEVEVHADDLTEQKGSFVYLSIPRSGMSKKPSNRPDGAEAASAAQRTMAWTSFVYDRAVWVHVRRLNRAIGELSNVKVLPAIKKYRIEPVDLHTVKILVPFDQNGHRLSIEFLDDTYYHLKPGTNHKVHLLPKHPLIVFANARPLISEERDLIPDQSGEGVHTMIPGQIDQIETIDAKTLYFPPGLYWFPGALPPKLNPNVNWVYLAPGAYLKGALVFQNTDHAVKVTGFGVISGENYEYGATKAIVVSNVTGPTHFLLNGVTVANQPFWTTGFDGVSENIVGDISNYKSVGGWYHQTDGAEPYRGVNAVKIFPNSGSIKHSFIHNNDDTLKMYESGMYANDIVVWKEDNGPVVQWGWWPRQLKDILVENIFVIHNSFDWNGIIDAYDNHTGGGSNPKANIENLIIRHIYVDGMAHRLFNLQLTANMKSALFENIYIERWNEVPGGYSSIRLVPNRRGPEQLTFADLKIRKFYVGETAISMEPQLDNWRHNQLGRLNIPVTLWGGWSVYE